MNITGMSNPIPTCEIDPLMTGVFSVLGIVILVLLLVILGKDEQNTVTSR